MLARLIRLYKKVVFSDSIAGIILNPFYISRSAIYRAIKRFSREVGGGFLLDVGCGSKPYRGLFSVEKYVGLDLETTGHDHSSSKVDVYYDGKTIPFENDKFDYVLSSEVFEHVFDIDELLAEIRRVMKPGGSLFVTVPFCWDEHEVPYDYARYTSYGLKHLLRKHGFEVVESIKTTSYISTVFQMLAAYVAQCILPKNRYVRVLLTPAFVFPITLLGLLLSLVLPDNKTFYLNNALHCKKSCSGGCLKLEGGYGDPV